MCACRVCACVFMSERKREGEKTEGKAEYFDLTSVPYQQGTLHGFSFETAVPH